MHIKKCIFRTTKVIKQGDPSQLFHAQEFIFLDIHLRSRFSRPHAAFLAMANTSNFCQCHSLPRCMADIVLPTKFNAPRTRNSDAWRSASPGAPCSGGWSHKFSCPLSLPSAERVYFVWRSGNAIPPKNHPFCSWVSYSWATDLTEEISTRWWCTTIVPVERNKFTWLKINY